MSENKLDQESEVDYQIGGHKVDMNATFDEEGMVKFEYEPSAVFKRLADDIYESAEAGIREPLTNSITAVRRAEQEHGIDDGVITITAQAGDQVLVRLQDNGIGISKAVLKEVLTVIGRSTNRDDGSVSGKYGMGFLASYKLVGMNGGFVMATNSRKTDNDGYSGVFKPGNFQEDTNGRLPQYLSDDEYGTVFEYYLKSELTLEDVRQWVEKHAKWSPIPIMYEELDKDGNSMYDDDFMSTDLSDLYNKPSFGVDTEYYEASCSPDSENEVILISSPVKARGTRSLRSGLPWQVDVRLKNEDGIVIKGPHEGMIPCNENEYNNLDDNEKSDYVLKDDLGSEDITLPEPTGTREKIRKNREFMKHVNSQLTDLYHDNARNAFKSFDPETDNLQNLSDMNRHILYRVINYFDEDDDKSDIRSTIKKKTGYDNPDEEIISLIQAMVSKLKVYSNNSVGRGYPSKKGHDLESSNSRIFMTVSNITTWKTEAIERSDEETKIVGVDSASEYGLYERHFGWEKVKDLKKGNAVDKLGLDEDVFESEIYGKNRNKSTNTDLGENQVTVHYGVSRDTIKPTADELLDQFDGGKITQNNSYRYKDVLVLFPQTHEKNISDYYHLTNNGCNVASCSSKKQYEYLTNNSESIYLYDEYMEMLKNISLMTNYGTKTVEDILCSERPSIFYFTDNSLFDSKYIMRGVAEYDSENYKLQQCDLKPIVAACANKYSTHIDNLVTEADLDMRGDRYLKTRFNECKKFAQATVSEEIRESKEFQALVFNNSNLNRQKVQRMELLGNSDKLHSLTDGSDKSLRMPDLTTKYGRIKLSEIYNRRDPENVLIHVAGPKVSEFEDQDILENLPTVITNDIVPTYEDEPMSFNSDTLYVPINSAEYERISESIDDDTTVIGPTTDADHYVSNTTVYATYYLNNWVGTDIYDIIISEDMPTCINLVNTLKSYHNDEEFNALDMDMGDLLRKSEDRIIKN